MVSLVPVPVGGLIPVKNNVIVARGTVATGTGGVGDADSSEVGTGQLKN